MTTFTIQTDDKEQTNALKAILKSKKMILKYQKCTSHS